MGGEAILQQESRSVPKIHLTPVKTSQLEQHLEQVEIKACVRNVEGNLAPGYIWQDGLDDL